MSLNLALSTAISGLSTAQAGLDVISNNIANVNTEGYTRKVFNPESVERRPEPAARHARSAQRRRPAGDY
jgi:flagellar hook-associated protein FlgK